MKCASIFLVLCVTALFLRLPEAQAQNIFERLVTPGDVAQSHAKFEKTCESCHEPFSKATQRRLCLECHKDIASDIASARGLHGKRADIVKAECKLCHTDHKGRTADIVAFDRATFSHADTDFALKGAHALAACEGCHSKGEKFRKAPKDCAGCHKKDDIHKGELGPRCETCHSEEDWRKRTAFDHAKTKFPLDGAHRKVACDVCHTGQRYKGLPAGCVDCHGVQDPHKGRYGSKCKSCHGVETWKKISFDHGKETKFPLRAAHAKAKCDDCHRGDLFADKLATACITCHKKNDVHNGQLGPRCETCHNETAWRQKVTFDHDLTRFPLIGLHAAVACEECHRSERYREAPKDCAQCHKDEAHQGRLGAQCQRCHNPNGWKRWRFDHARETDFPLTGAHTGVKCEACHTARAETKVTAPKTCFACHSKDDAHRGGFGRSCEKCHGTSSFRDALKVR